MKKYHFIFDKTNKNKAIKNFFIKKYKNYPVEMCSCIIVLLVCYLLVYTPYIPYHITIHVIHTCYYF